MLLLQQKGGAGFSPATSAFEPTSGDAWSPNLFPQAITTALSGFRKTTIAAALCHDEDIIKNFDVGILWVTLGQNPDVLASLVTV